MANNVSTKAEQFIVAAGGAVSEDGQISWPDGTKFREDKSISHGGWGNFTYNCWELPTGRFIGWDSDDRRYYAPKNP